MDLKILGTIVIDIINILEHNNCENNLIIKVENHNPLKLKRVIGRVEGIDKGKPRTHLLKDK